MGLGKSVQKIFYLPEAQTDFILAVIGEELGVAGIVGVVFLYGMIAYAGLRTARRAATRHAKLLATGLTSLILCQSLLNVFVVLGLAPLTGVPLPFISYAQTNLCVMLASVGLLLNLSRPAPRRLSTVRPPDTATVDADAQRERRRRDRAQRDAAAPGRGRRRGESRWSDPADDNWCAAATRYDATVARSARPRFLMPRVKIFAWNPRRTSLPPRIDRWLPIGRRVNNFGDLLGPLLVERMLALYGIDPATARKDCQLMSVGSVLHFAHDSDVVWGSGVNGKAPAAIHRFHSLDVRAVRGPLTQAFLAQRGIHVPEIYGDPALLLPHVAPELFDVPARNVNEVTIVPNVNDYSRYAGDPRAVNPRAPMDLVLKRIAGSKFVAGSSLHGIVVAESLGIPARLIASEIEQAFKYEDYYLGTGRQGMEAAGSIEEAVALDGRDLPRFDREALLQAFPSDLWASPE